MCRVSTQITGSSAAVNALTSHCDSGPFDPGNPGFLLPQDRDDLLFRKP